MFNTVYKMWLNTSDTPALVIKVNLWSYVNIRFFKLKLSKHIIYFILSTNTIREKYLKFFYNDFLFTDIYFRVGWYLFFFIVGGIIFL